MLLRSKLIIPRLNKIFSRSKIYTRKGDKGKSSLYNGQELGKNSEYFKAMGAIDELSSQIGMSIEFLKEEKHPAQTMSQLILVQSLLREVGGSLATPKGSSVGKENKNKFPTEHTINLELWIDLVDETLPKLNKFILPSGGKGAVSLHICRAVCRRAENHIAALLEEENVDIEVAMFINRLSDYFFTLARFAQQVNHNEGTNI